MDLTEIMDGIDSLQRQIDELRVKANRDGWEAFNKAIPLLFEKYPGLKQLAIQGFTPGFNDGDPCVHRTYYYVDNDDWSEYDEDKYYDAEKDDYVMVNDITNEQAQDIRNVLNKFRTILKYQYGTGWEVFISKNADGVVSINKDYYDPGY